MKEFLLPLNVGETSAWNSVHLKLLWTQTVRLHFSTLSYWSHLTFHIGLTQCVILGHYKNSFESECGREKQLLSFRDRSESHLYSDLFLMDKAEGECWKAVLTYYEANSDGWTPVTTCHHLAIHILRRNRLWKQRRGCVTVAERLFCMQTIPGSVPSIFSLKKKNNY